MNSDFKELLRAFNDSEVEYLVIGGYAVMHYSEPRFTKDLDLWVNATAANADRVFRALAAFGAPLAGMKPEDFAKAGTFYQMGRPPVRVDILMSVTGMTFGSAWPNRVLADFGGVIANVVAKADLITIKRALGRPRDILDADELDRAP